jgi:undecaprenyl-diphosphatase
MGRVDIQILYLLNEAVERSRTLDVLLVYLLSNTPFKGLLFAALMWWAWFRPGQNKTTDRKAILLALLASVASLCISRLLQLSLPFRSRPILDSTLNLRIPDMLDPEAIVNISSFPSDHAAFFYALAMGFWLLSRRLGAVLLMIVTLLICLPRLMLGYHFPTDVIAGALIAFGTVIGLMRTRILDDSVTGVSLWEQRSPGTLYTCFFVLTYLIATLFNVIPLTGEFILAFVAALT